MDPFPDESMKDLKIPRHTVGTGATDSDPLLSPSTYVNDNIPSSDSVYLDAEDTECVQASPEDCMDDMRSPRFTTEAWEIIRAATPLTAGFFADHFIEIIHLMFLGRLAADELASAALALLYCNVTGLCLIMGIMNGIETMAAQALGARSYRRLNVILQRGLLIGAVGMIPIYILRYYAHNLLIFFGMELDIAARAAEFIAIASINIPALVIQEGLRRYAQAVDRGDVTLYNTLCGLALTPLLNYILVVKYQLGCLGVAWSVVISSYLMAAQLILYYCFSSKPLFPHSEFAFTMEAFQHWPGYLRLAIPGTVSLAAEWIGLEAQSIVAARAGARALGAQSIMFNLTLQLFMPSMAMGMVVSARVGRYLGAGQPNAAKFAAKVAMTLSFLSMLIMGAVVLTCGGGVGRAFTTDPGVLHAMDLCLPLLVVYCLLDGMQGAAAGVARGAGMQNIAFKINIIAYWFVALPLAYVLALKIGHHTDLDVFFDSDTYGKVVSIQGWGLQGQWVAMAITSAGVCLAMIGVLWGCMDWNAVSKKIVDNEVLELAKDDSIGQALSERDEESGLLQSAAVNSPGSDGTIYGSIN